MVKYKQYLELSNVCTQDSMNHIFYFLKNHIYIHLHKTYTFKKKYTVIHKCLVYYNMKKQVAPFHKSICCTEFMTWMMLLIQMT